MQIDRITVEAALTVPHPTIPYANARPSVQVSASISPEDDVDECYRLLRSWANGKCLDMLKELQK